ncbi:SDR family oxidoreductase [Nonomuraea maritima]|uniref:SDR family oxidoreductase n=1 Tax=Nonomuraea maritima TaxID=683260 RepID=UPI003712AF20
MKEQSGRVVVITGAGSGIGRHAALALHGEGYRVVLAGRRVAPLQETARATGGTDDRVLVAPCDVTETTSVHELFARCAERFGGVDVLVNNAGVFGPAVPFDEISPDAWSDVVRTNLTGAFLCAQEAFRHMKARGGRIINNGSLSAHVPRPYATAYTATKHAITGLTKAISLEGRAYGIACGQIDIGNAATDMTEAMSRGVPQADGSIAPEPTMDVRRAAEAIVFMAGLPLDANVQFMTVMATTMPFVGRG